MVLGRAIASLAAVVDHVIYSETPGLSACLQWCLFHCAADAWLNPLFQGAAYNAATVSIAVIVVYIVFVVIYAPLYLCSYVLTGWGSFALMIFAIVLLLRWFARSMTFAGLILQFNEKSLIEVFFIQVRT
jgi:hypothetical protein